VLFLNSAEANYKTTSIFFFHKSLFKYTSKSNGWRLDLRKNLNVKPKIYYKNIPTFKNKLKKIQIRDFLFYSLPMN
jgi:hypothetical protein